MSDSVINTLKNSQSSHDPQNTQVLRGGGPSFSAAGASALETGFRLFVRAADAIKDRMHAFGGMDPARPLKNVTGIASGFVSGDQAFQDALGGHVGDAIFHTFQSASIFATSVPRVTDTIAHAIKDTPYTRAMATKLAQRLSNVKMTKDLVMASGDIVAADVPLVGAAMNLGSGALGTGARLIKGDGKGAMGEAVTTVVGVGVYAAVLIVTTVGSAACGPLIAVCAAASLPVAAAVAYGLSETATEVTARIYNHYAGTDVRGSSLVTLGDYALKRIPQLSHSVDEKLNETRASIKQHLPAMIAWPVTHVIDAVSMSVKNAGAIATGIDHGIQAARQGVSAAWHWADTALSGKKEGPVVPAHPPQDDATEQRLARLHAHGKRFELAPNVLAQLEQHGFKPLMDKNHDGHIDRNEVKATFQELHLKVKDVDPNHSGLATPKEVAGAINATLKARAGHQH